MFKKLWKKGAASGGAGGKSSGERSSHASHDPADSSRVAPMPVPSLLLSSNLDRLADEKAKGAPSQKNAGVSGADPRRIRKKLTLETTETVDLWDLMHGLEEDEESDNWLGKPSPGGPLPDLNPPPNRQEITDIVRSALKKVLDPDRGREFENGRGGKDFLQKVLPLSEVLPLSRQSSRSPAGSSDGGFRSRDQSLDGVVITNPVGSERRSSGGSAKSLSPRGVKTLSPKVTEVRTPSPDVGTQAVRPSLLPASKSTGNLLELEFASPPGPVSPATLRRHFTFPTEDAVAKAHGRKAMSVNGLGDVGGGALFVKEGFSGDLSGKVLGLPRIKVRGDVSKTRDDISVRSGDPWGRATRGEEKGTPPGVSIGGRATRGEEKARTPPGVGHRPARLIEKAARRGDEWSPVSRAAEQVVQLLRQGKAEQGKERTLVAAVIVERGRDGNSASVAGDEVLSVECERGVADERLLQKDGRGKLELREISGVVHKGGTGKELEGGEINGVLPEGGTREKPEGGGISGVEKLRVEDVADLDEIARLRRISAEVSDDVSETPKDEVRRRRDARELEDDVSEISFAFQVRRPPNDDVFGSPISAAGPLFDPEMLASFEEDLQTMSEEEWQAQKGSGVGERVSVLGRSPSGGLETASISAGEKEDTGLSLWGAIAGGKVESGSGMRDAKAQSRQVLGASRTSMGGAAERSGNGQVSTGGLAREASMDDGGLEEVMSEVENFLSRLEHNASTSWERGVQQSLSAGGGNVREEAPGVAPRAEAGNSQTGSGVTSQVTGPSKTGLGSTNRSPKGSPRGRALGKPPLSPRRMPKNSPPVSPGKSTPLPQRNPPPRGEDRIVVYTTSVRAVRKTFEECNRVRGVFSGHGVHVDERDISMHAEFRDELRVLMAGPTPVPQVFVRGKHIGGVEELQRLNDSRELLPLLEGFERHKRRGPCDSCGGVRFHLCHTCNGSCKVVSANSPDGTVRCPNCNENGLRMCAVCA